MARYFTDFSNESLGGGIPSDIGLLLGGITSATIVSSSENESGKALEVKFSANNSVLTFDAVGPVTAGTPVCVRVLVSQDTYVGVTGGPAARLVGGTNTTRRGVYAYRRTPATSFLEAVGRVGNTATTLFSGAGDATWGALWVSVSVDGAMNCAADVRAPSDTNTILAAGNAAYPVGAHVDGPPGFWAVSFANAFVIHAISVGTGADAADTPFGPPEPPPAEVSPGTGSIVAQGHTPQIQQPRVFVPGAARAIIQGHAPIVVRGDAQAVAPGVAHILLRGRAPTIQQPRTVVPKTTHAVITGRSPIVVQGDAQAIAPGVAHVVLQGRAPAIQQPRSVAPGAAHIAVRGYAPAVIQGDAQAITPGAGRVAVAGHAPQVHQPRGIAPGVAHVAVSGHAPVIDQIASIRPHTSHILVQGHPPAISQPQTIEPGAGHAVIAGHAPILVQGLQIRPGAGRILVSGHAPVVEQGGARELQPGTARVLYRGYAPLITGAQAAPPPAHRIYRVPGPLRLFTVPAIEVPCS